MKSHTLWSFVSGFFHLDTVFKAHSCGSKYQNFISFMAVQCSIVPIHRIGLFVSLLMDFWVISTFWTLRITLIWTFMYKFLCGHIFKFFWFIPKSGIVGSEVWETSRLFFHNGGKILHSHQQCMRVLISPHPQQHLSSVFFRTAQLMGVNYYLTVLFTWISSWLMMLSDFSCAYWPPKSLLRIAVFNLLISRHT